MILSFSIRKKKADDDSEYTERITWKGDEYSF